jgi:DNA mismatch repair ATPase MutS
MESVLKYLPEMIQSSSPKLAGITGKRYIVEENASGKSTFVKAIAINAILAQTINTCLAHIFL